ncbi:MAG: putative sugar kinase [Symbiobacteriaceae bacterium]|jgi:sugar/nucleoside kinase (ribokinase family)|nr:putative sugar kinase [Symbiobacteriaceae bacterium]
MDPLFTFGDLVLDVVAQVADQLDADTDTPGDVMSAPGGSAANLAAWTARLGDPVRFACRVGDDMLGRALVDDMRREGVEPFAATDPDHPTAVLVLFAQGTQRHMMVPRGANHYLDVADIPAQALLSSGWLHVTGYSFFWEATARAAGHALSLARQSGIPISFDPSSAGFIRRHGLEVPDGVQVILTNHEEALALTGATSPGDAAHELARNVPLVAVKMGAAGALICHEGQLSHIPGAELDGPVVDTVGAGDAWGAGFISLLRRGWEPVRAAEAANRLAALTVTRRGARPAIIMPDEFSRQGGSPHDQSL